MREIRVATSNPLKVRAVRLEERRRVVGVPVRGGGVPRGLAAIVQGALRRARHVRGVGFESGFVGNYMVCACAIGGRVAFGPAFLVPKGARLSGAKGVVYAVTKEAHTRLEILRTAYRAARAIQA